MFSCSAPLSRPAASRRPARPTDGRHAQERADARRLPPDERNDCKVCLITQIAENISLTPLQLRQPSAASQPASAAVTSLHASTTDPAQACDRLTHNKSVSHSHSLPSPPPTYYLSRLANTVLRYNLVSLPRSSQAQLSTIKLSGALSLLPPFFVQQGTLCLFLTRLYLPL